MPVKTITCNHPGCGKEITKRKSRLVDGQRICKDHEEAQEFAEKDQKDRVAKAQRAVSRISKSRRRDEPSLTTLGMIGGFWVAAKRQREQRLEQGREMLFCIIKAKLYELFLLQAAKPSDPAGLLDSVRVAWRDWSTEFLEETHEHIRPSVRELVAKASEGLAEQLTDRLCADVSVVDDMLDERGALLTRNTELRKVVETQI